MSSNIVQRAAPACIVKMARDAVLMDFYIFKWWRLEASRCTSRAAVGPRLAAALAGARRL
jgi:hypothetical protein